MNAMYDLIAHTFQEEAGRVIAALYTSIRDLEVVEDALQDALVLAMERWPVHGSRRPPGTRSLTGCAGKTR
jgi:RNA polymerase sigma-70 factor (ECF subfamily)